MILIRYFICITKEMLTKTCKMHHFPTNKIEGINQMHWLDKFTGKGKKKWS